MGRSIKELNEEIGDVAQRVANTEQVVAAVAGDVSTVLQRFEGLEELLRGMSARQRPAAPDTDRIVVSELDDPNATGIAEVDPNGGIVQSRVTDVESPEFAAKEAALAFERQLVEIEIESTSEKQADPVFSVGVNGRTWVLWRGQRYVVPRYVVGVLAQAKPVHYDNQEYTSHDGVRGIRWPSRRGLRYPFHVVRDPAGDLGRRWLQALQAAA